MDTLIPAPSQQPPLAAVATQPTALLGARPASSQHAPLTALWDAHDAKPVQFLRTPEGRNLSQVRYLRAEEFMTLLAPDMPGYWTTFLHNAGIVAQLGLSAHLLDVGFPDDWCARYIGLHVSRSLAYANATGLGLECPETRRLAQVLSPYSKWNLCSRLDGPAANDGGFTSEEVRILLRALLDHTACVTGHKNPRQGAES